MGAYVGLFWAFGAHVGPIGVHLGPYVAVPCSFCVFVGPFGVHFGTILGAIWEPFLHRF